jgi:repressor LexA
MPRSNELTDRQKQIYDFLVAHLHEHGFPPTVREICAEFGIRSTKGVTDHLTALQKKGFIKKHPEASRGIEILRRPRVFEDAVEVPLLGRIAAGSPTEALENPDGHLTVDRSILPKGDSFALKVNGDSMIGAHILDGDYVIVRAQQQASDGDIVAVRENDEATLKRLFRTQDEIVLRAENPEMEPIVYSGPEREEVRILGIVAAVIRRCGS